MPNHPVMSLGSRLVSGDPFLSLQRGMNRLFDDVFRGAELSGFGGPSHDSGMILPQMNVSETDKEVRITAELPGVAEKDVDVTLDDDVLTIRGEKRSETKEDNENYQFVERSFGRFQRSIRVPHSVKADEVKAHVENGVLTVVLPKNQAQEKTRHIQVQSGAR